MLEIYHSGTESSKWSVYVIDKRSFFMSVLVQHSLAASFICNHLVNYEKGFFLSFLQDMYTL